MIYKRLTIPVLPRLKVSVRIVSDTVHEFDLILAIYGLDRVRQNGPMSNSGTRHLTAWRGRQCH